MSEGGALETPAFSPRQSVYSSKVDWWIVVLLLAGPLACVVLAAMLMTQGKLQDALTMLVIGAATLMLTGLVTVPCRYTLLDDSLSIRCGVYFTRIPLDRIRAIEPSRSWLSGPALSLQRIKVSTASRYYLISPADRDRFIEELTAAVKRNR